MKNKKIFIYLGLIIIFFIILISIYFYFQKNNIYYSNNLKKIELVTTDRIFYPFYIKDKNKIDYLSDLGIIWYQFDIANNQKTKIIDEDIVGNYNILYQTNGNNAIVFYDYPNVNIKHYDFSKNTVYDLNNNIMDIIWSNQKTKIFYVYNYLPGPEDEENSQKYVYSICQADYDGTNWSTILDLSNSNYDNVSLYNSDNENFIYYLAQTSNGSTLYKLDINKKTTESITEENNIKSDLVFSPDKTKIAYINKDNKLTTQTLSDKKTSKIFDIKITNIEQSIWGNDNNTIYVLKDLSNLISINNDKRSQKQYNIDSSSVSEINTMDEIIKMVGINKDDNLIYFMYNNYLYQINLQ